MAVAIDYSVPDVDDYGPIPPEEAVLTEDMLPLLRDYAAKAKRAWDHDHPCDSRGSNKQFAPWGMLSLMSGVPERRIYGAVNGETALMDLDIADRLCIAIDRHISEVPVYEKKYLLSLAREQGELVRLVARTHGVVIPIGKDAQRLDIPRWRRRLTVKARQCQ